MPAEGWARFESTIRQRRIQRRSAAARAALKRGNLVEAQAALAEIYELDPGNPRISSLKLELDAARERRETRRIAPSLAAAIAFGAAMLSASSVEAPVILHRVETPAMPETLVSFPFSGIASLVDGYELQPRFTDAIASDTPAAEVEPRATPATIPPSSQSPVQVTALTAGPGAAELPAAASLGPPPSIPPALPPPVIQPIAAIAAPAMPMPASARVDDNERSIRQALERYRAAYERLDARSAQQVWPAVNEPALARAFSGLRMQTLTFDQCDVRIRGTSATAACSGSARYVPKVGSQEPRIESRLWDFTLRQAGTDWKIEAARTDR